MKIAARVDVEPGLARVDFTVCIVSGLRSHVCLDTARAVGCGRLKRYRLPTAQIRDPMNASSNSGRGERAESSWCPPRAGSTRLGPITEPV